MKIFLRKLAQKMRSIISTGLRRTQRAANYCFIFPLDPHTLKQSEFNRLMENLELPEGVIEEVQLEKLLAAVAEQLGEQVGYHLSRDEIDGLTTFYFQNGSNPRTDGIILRKPCPLLKKEI